MPLLQGKIKLPYEKFAFADPFSLNIIHLELSDTAELCFHRQSQAQHPWYFLRVPQSNTQRPQRPHQRLRHR
jgi:hypothetical protein